LITRPLYSVSTKTESARNLEMGEFDVTPQEIEELYVRLKKEAEEGGYNLNPDVDFVKDLLHGLLVNKKRFGYLSCPCRLATGNSDADLDIICPCDYRDQDLTEFGACYCALYVSQDVVLGRRKVRSIPERRPAKEMRTRNMTHQFSSIAGNLPYPVWRCRVCGYLCARENPPSVCPICKAGSERFEIFM
jgi:ferredoxin-thioredoxin reductase catalytic chain